MSANLVSAILFNFRNTIYISFKRPIFPRNFLDRVIISGIAGMVIAIIVTFLTIGTWIRLHLCDYISCGGAQLEHLLLLEYP